MRTHYSFFIFAICTLTWHFRPIFSYCFLFVMNMNLLFVMFWTVLCFLKFSLKNVAKSCLKMTSQKSYTRSSTHFAWHDCDVQLALRKGLLSLPHLLLGCNLWRFLETKPRVNFINVFTRSFNARRSQKHKKLLELTIFFCACGTCMRRSCT